MSGRTIRNPIPKVCNSSSGIYSFEDEFIEAFPSSNPWVIHGLHRMHEEYMRAMQFTHVSLAEAFNPICNATVSLMTMTQLEWCVERSHPNMPYGALFRKEIAERLLIGK